MYANVAPGSVIQAEYWDDALPLSISPTHNASAFSYSWASFDFYHDPPAPEAADNIFAQIGKVDFVVMSSNRVSSAMPQSPWRYPVQTEYYALLQAERLGFELVAEFQTKPSFLGIEFDDRNADESFINYDHPRVLIFQKVRELPRAEFDALMADAVAQPVTPRRHAVTETILLDEPVGDLPVVSDARWSARWTSNNAVALVTWIVLLLVLQVAGLPLALLAFRRFADRGWAFARIASLLVSGWVVWALASLEVLSFRAIWIWIALALLGGVWFVRRVVATNRLRHAWADRSIRRSIVVGEVIFWSVFSYFLLLRYLNPDSWHVFWGGEKPMEFAHLNAILRSAHFPPYDPWFSDGYINYYYYGLYLVAFLIKATGIPSEIAFNLAQPTIIAFLALGGYGLATTLGRAIARNRAHAWVIGLVSVVVLSIMGNLASAVRIVQTLPDEIRPDFGWFWGPTRIVEYSDARTPSAPQITEFPYFTALFADLHAHVVAMPITVFAMAIGLAIALEHRAILVAFERRRIQRALPAIGLGLLAALVVGSLFPTNAWDFFTYAVFIVAACFLAFRQFSWPAQLGFTAIVGGVIIAIGYVLYLPFHSNFVTLFSQVKQSQQKTDIWQFSQHFGGLFLLVLIGLSAVAWARSEQATFAVTPSLATLAAAIILIGTWVLDRFISQTNSVAPLLFVGGFSALALAASAWWRAAESIAWNRHVVLIGGFAVVGLLLVERYVMALCVAMAILAATIFFAAKGTHERITALAATAGFAIPVMVETVYVVDDLDGGLYARMNTMFKFYNQAWVMLAIAGGVLTGWIVLEALTHSRIRHWRDRQSGTSAMAPLILIMAVISASLAYPLTATIPRLDTKAAAGIGNETSLNALDWMHYATYKIPGGPLIAWQDDLAAINWFNENVDGSPVIVEASIGAYRGNGSRFSIATGLPTVLGWERHEQQQRYREDSAQRVVLVQSFYQTDSIQEKIDFLLEFGVEYVVVGDLERFGVLGENEDRPYSTPEGIAAIESMVGQGLEVAFQQGSTTIYRVVPEALIGAAP
jgi:YYY domain-containing protein